VNPFCRIDFSKSERKRVLREKGEEFGTTKFFFLEMGCVISTIAAA
jgi:hypothetical protein